MSAFLVESIVISKILAEVEKSIRGSEWFKREMAKELQIDFSNPQWQTRLGQQMLDLNQQALRNCYGDPEQGLAYTFCNTSSTRIHALKSLQCWLYQCCEGNIPETAMLYKFFDTVVVRMWAVDVVMKTAEYDT